MGNPEYRRRTALNLMERSGAGWANYEPPLGLLLFWYAGNNDIPERK
jgi:hypothetical protein